MSTHILAWIKEDLEKQGKELKDYTLIELKSVLQNYNNRYNR